ncbi:Dam family site-specific DNA-(adenine-N6)-methyltransferase [Salmonella enterica]|nr:Dam family site-specific DNA-(adenine-N6)-methyltransferase [Salmonella enterica]
MAVKTPLKWVGSKARLMPQLRPHLPEGKRLVEPFAGSCAVMMNTDYDEYLIADVNPDLVNLYKAMAYHTDALLNELEILFNAGSLGDEESRAVFYYAVRDAFNQSGKSFGSESVEAAARFLYLNRHCFNGLYLYAGFNSVRVNAPRSVGAAAASPKMAAELILKWPLPATPEASA